MLFPNTRTITISVFIFLYIAGIAHSATWVIQDHDDLAGEIQIVTAQAGETLYDVGLRHDIGLLEMKAANPGVDSESELSSGTKVIIPSCYILPKGARHGLVINLAEYRLYYFPEGDNVVITMPVGIGRTGWSTPTGTTKVVDKVRDPVWHPTAKLKAEAEKNGAFIPDEFPSGYGNPLGKHALRLGWPTYLIHGTNRRDGIGTQVSAGCLRMIPEDIEYLFEFVALGTTVRIINEPIKIGQSNGNTYLEVHKPLDGGKYVLPAIKENHSVAVRKELDSPTGIPQKIS